MRHVATSLQYIMAAYRLGYVEMHISQCYPLARRITILHSLADARGHPGSDECNWMPIPDSAPAGETWTHGLGRYFASCRWTAVLQYHKAGTTVLELLLGYLIWMQLTDNAKAIQSA